MSKRVLKNSFLLMMYVAFWALLIYNSAKGERLETWALIICFIQWLTMGQLFNLREDVGKKLEEIMGTLSTYVRVVEVEDDQD